MKRKLLVLAASLAALLLLAGCGDYSAIETQLNEITIENKLPTVSEKKYKTMEDAEEAVYEQQMAACEMLSNICDETYYEQYYEKEGGNRKRVSAICNDKRNEISADVKQRYYKNLYEIMDGVTDCPNVDAYVTKTYNNVLTFYDEYNKYRTADEPDVALTNILVYYYDRTNVLAKSFLVRNKQKVFDAASAVVEGNAQADDNFRFYIGKNNIIIKALNEIYGGVPGEYAKKINSASNELAKNLLDSMESLSDRERAALMAEYGLSTEAPTATPKPTATPSPEPGETPAATPAPAVTAAPKATPTPTPKVTPTPTPKAQQQTQVQEQTQEQTHEEENNSSSEQQEAQTYDLD